MPLVKRTVYIDTKVDKCVRETKIALERRDVPQVSYSLALNIMLAANILDLARGNGLTKSSLTPLRNHARNPSQSLITQETVELFIKEIEEPITYVTQRIRQ